MRQQAGLFEDQRLTPARAMDITAEALRGYAARYRHWGVAFSGGKDSTATVTAVVHLIETGRVPAPETLSVLLADTRMELPPLYLSALAILAELERRGVRTRVVRPAMDDRFFVYMFGRGVPPPSNTFRWCTPQIKIEPMLTALSDLREMAGEKLLMLTGVRVGESAARDQRIAVSCGKNGAECGQGWFQASTPEGVADTLAPLLHWRLCHVWDWLMGLEADHGFPTAPVAQIYGVGEDGSPEEVNARTGCVGCNLASRDVALERVLRLPGWGHLAPLLRLRPLYADLKRASNRLRHQDERRKDGTPVDNQGRLGPLTMEARRWGLAQVKAIQDEVNAAAPAGQPPFLLIDAQEEARIGELMAANTWPRRWTGDEVRGDVLLPVEFTRGGGRQARLLMEGLS